MDSRGFSLPFLRKIQRFAGEISASYHSQNRLNPHKLPGELLPRAALRWLVAQQRAQVGGAALQIENGIAPQLRRIGDDGEP